MTVASGTESPGERMPAWMIGASLRFPAGNAAGQPTSAAAERRAWTHKSSHGWLRRARAALVDESGGKVPALLRIPTQPLPLLAQQAADERDARP